MNGDVRNDWLVFAEILAMWAAQGETDPISRGRLAAEVDRWTCLPSDVREILGQPQVGPGDLLARKLYITGPRVTAGTPTFIPRATARIGTDEDGFLEVGLRVALLFAADGKVNMAGWRFDLADRKGEHPPHPYPHAQHIEDWAKDVPIQAVAAPEARGRGEEIPDRLINQQRPAFPLRGGNTASGLAVVMLATLYGAPTVRSWMRLLTPAYFGGKLPKVVQDDIKSILG